MPGPEPRTIARCSEQFQAPAVYLGQLPGARVQDVAAPLCIHPFMLSRWRKLARESSIMTKGVAADAAVAAGLKELRRVEKWRRSLGPIVNGDHAGDVLYEGDGSGAAARARSTTG